MSLIRFIPAIRRSILAALLLAGLLSSPVRAEIPAGALRPNDLIVSQELPNHHDVYDGIIVLDGVTGQKKGDFVLPNAGGLDTWALDMTIGPDGNLYVSDYRKNQVLRYSGTTGAFIDQFVTPGSGGLGHPVGVAFLPDGNLYVADNGGEGGTCVRRYNGLTGESLGVAVPHQYFTSNPDYDPNDPDAWVYDYFNGYYTYPEILLYGADGNLYISVYPTGTVLRHNPVSGTTETFATHPASGGAFDRMAFGPDGVLYVREASFGIIHRFDGRTGAVLPDFASEGTSAGLCTNGFAFGPDGKLYIGSNLTFDPASGGYVPGADGILRVDPSTGAFLGQFSTVPSAGFLFNAGVTPVSATPLSISPLPTATVTFDAITAAGQTTVTPLQSDSTPLPENFQVAAATGGFATFFDITTTAAFGGSAELAIGYDPAQYRFAAASGAWENFDAATDTWKAGGPPVLLHYENGAWKDITAEWVRDRDQKDGVQDGRTMVNGVEVVGGVDAAGRKVYGLTTSFSPFAVATRRAYSWSGILQPVNADGTSVFRQGSTVPVKFRLAGADAGITDLRARLYLARVSDSVAGTQTEAASTSAADSGNTFRYDAGAGQYVFNLSTKGLARGTWQLRVDLGDGAEHKVNIGLTK